MLPVIHEAEILDQNYIKLTIELGETIYYFTGAIVEIIPKEGKITFQDGNLYWLSTKAA